MAAGKRPPIFRWLILLLLLPFLPQVPGCVMANTPKIGQVVDATTGKGVPNVWVMATANFSAGPIIHGSANHGVYRVIVRTDAEGHYWIPNTWRYFEFGIPGTDPIEQWIITVFKPGYALEGDEASWQNLQPNGLPSTIPLSKAESPKSIWLGIVVKVQPLRLKPVELSLHEAAIYYDSLFKVGFIESQTMQDNHVLSEEANKYFQPRVCALPVDTIMSFTDAALLIEFVRNPDISIKYFKKFMPEKPPHSMDDLTFRAGDVCETMKSEGVS